MIKNFKCYFSNRIVALLVVGVTGFSFTGCNQQKDEKMIIGTSSYSLVKDDNSDYIVSFKISTDLSAFIVTFSPSWEMPLRMPRRPRVSRRPRNSLWVGSKSPR